MTKNLIVVVSELAFIFQIFVLATSFLFLGACLNVQHEKSAHIHMQFYKTRSIGSKISLLDCVFW